MGSSWVFRAAVGAILFLCWMASAGDYYDRGSKKPSTLTISVLEAALKLERPAFTSVESFLAWVETHHPDHLEGVTFVRKSGSLQGASSLHPRAIVFGPDAKFLFTFNGHSDQEGFHKVEIIAFRDTWEFRELSFAKDGKAAPVLSAANPTSCTRCHYSPLRPIWEPYDRWPGVYGEKDDALIDFRAEKYAPLGKTSEFIKTNLEELDAFREFQKSVAGHPRYQKLKLPEGSPVSPYNTMEKSGFLFRPNLRLTEALAPLHAKHLTKWIARDVPLFKAVGPALVQSLIPVCESMDKATKTQLATEAAGLFDGFFPGRQLAPYAKEGWAGGNSPSGRLLGIFGIENMDFHLGRKPEYWNYFVGGHYLDAYLAKELHLELSKVVGGLPDFEMTTAYSYKVGMKVTPTANPLAKVTEHEICDVLEKRGNLKSAERPPQIVVHPVATCLECHGGKHATAPPLALNAELPRGLLERVRERVASADPMKRMPPERTLSQKELEALTIMLRKSNE